MRLTVNQLPSHLKQHLVPIYFVTGDEFFLVDEACALIRAAAKKNGYCGHEFFQIDSHFNWENLTQQTDTLSLFDTHSLLELRLTNNKISESAKKFVQEYAKNPTDQKILLFICGKLTGQQLQAQWLRGIDQIGVILQIWPLERQQLPAWINQRLQAIGLRADQNACQLLAYHCEGNLLAAAQEIEKLRLLYPEGQITTEMITAVTSDQSRFDIFILTDSALAGESMRVYRVMQGLKQEGIEPILVLWALTREVRLLAQLAAKAASADFNEIFKRAGIWPRRQSLVKQALRRKSPLAWCALLQQANELDHLVKGARAGDIWLELCDFALAISRMS
jgi:DNA polymerase-3 subunit delta